MESHGLAARNVVKTTNRVNSIYLHLLLVYPKGSALFLCLVLARTIGLLLGFLLARRTALALPHDLTG
ncbi:hypothetical protein ACVMIH_007273 [Bradyrhizobium sp. USDA 4503]